jgi:hypothetical protein
MRFYFKSIAAVIAEEDDTHCYECSLRRRIDDAAANGHPMCCTAAGRGRQYKLHADWGRDIVGWSFAYIEGAPLINGVPFAVAVICPTCRCGNQEDGFGLDLNECAANLLQSAPCENAQ